MPKDAPKTPDDVKRIVDDRDVRFIRLWFTDILGQLKSFSINREELDDAFEGGMGFDGSSITGFNPIEESDMIAMPDPDDLRRPAVAPGGQGDRAHVLRRPGSRRRAVRGRPALGAAARARADALDGLRQFNVGPELEYFYFRSADTSTARPRCSTGAATSTSRRSTPAPTCGARRCSRSSSSASTSSTATTRSVPRSTRSTCATRTRSRWPTTA